MCDDWKRFTRGSRGPQTTTVVLDAVSVMRSPRYGTDAVLTVNYKRVVGTQCRHCTASFPIEKLGDVDRCEAVVRIRRETDFGHLESTLRWDRCYGSWRGLAAECLRKFYADGNRVDYHDDTEEGRVKGQWRE